MRIQKVHENNHVTFSICTNYTYKDSQGRACIDTFWALVRHMLKENDTELPDKLKQGAWVEVEGRLKSERYIGADGVERHQEVIIANKVQVIDSNED
ncbi:MAG: single-stranded DNA-binding protein [Clostridia bacterium]|nr:single-stranded DNA-binding protein [Clostridia bacterium]